jgi:hypothetical protein
MRKDDTGKRGPTNNRNTNVKEEDSDSEDTKTLWENENDQ